MSGKYSVALSKIIAAEGYTPIYLPRSADEIMISSMEVNRPGLILARYDKNFTPERIEFLGNSEYLFLEDLSLELRNENIERLMREQPAACVFSVMVPKDLIQDFVPFARTYEVPLLQASDHTSIATTSLVEFLNVELAERETRHGVLVEVSGEGVLIVGDSGVG
ncbi:MAG TPA: HPr kinase/phosphorylase, partial [Clostridiales bacterium]|nr:HPr kinase/phosphorylase [Clostridiales bacterium]